MTDEEKDLIVESELERIMEIIESDKQLTIVDLTFKEKNMELIDFLYLKGIIMTWNDEILDFEKMEKIEKKRFLSIYYKLFLDWPDRKKTFKRGCLNF